MLLMQWPVDEDLSWCCEQLIKNPTKDLFSRQIWHLLIGLEGNTLRSYLNFANIL
jgi:hypothetical protein